MRFLYIIYEFAKDTREEGDLLLAAFMVIWSLIILPVIVKVNIAFSDDLLPVAVFHFKTVGISFHVKCRLVVNEDGLDFKVSLMRNSLSSEKSVKAMGNKKLTGWIKTDRQLLRYLSSYAASAGFHLKCRIGTGDAAMTALVCGTLSSVSACFPRARVLIVPDFRTPQVCMQLKCIAFFRLGKLFLSAAAILRSAVMQSVREKTGGLVHG